MGIATVYTKRSGSDLRVFYSSLKASLIILWTAGCTWQGMKRRGKGESKGEISHHGDAALTKNTALERRLSRSNGFENGMPKKHVLGVRELIEGFFFCCAKILTKRLVRALH